MEIELNSKQASRFWSKVLIGGDDHCWPWIHSRFKYGYGRLRVGRRPGKIFLAHRTAFWLCFGYSPICALHRCDNPPCCNPRHIFDGSRSDNNTDRAVKYRSAVGERHGRAKLSDNDVSEIRSAYSHYPRGHDGQNRPGNQSELAKLYGVSRTQIRAIVNGRSWICLN